MSSTGGYVADIAYTAGFYPETAPAHIAFAALCRTHSPGLAWLPRRVLELGFGQGFGLALLAAANPNIAFEGCDFNIEHVAHARGLIHDAKLANLAVSHQSFEHAAAQGDNDVDIAILHGVLSWIDSPSRRAVVSILERRLRPNGVAYVSYNCMPGWAPLAPIRQLMREIKRRTPGNSELQLTRALELIEKLWHGNAGYFVMNPMATHHVASMRGMDRAYLAHEYLADHAELPQFSNVAALLSGAGLSYLASAAILDNFDAYAASESVQPLIGQIEDPILRETVRDFAANRKFRRDIFSRGTAELPPDERRRVLSRMKFTLAVPRARLTLKFLGPVGDLTLEPAFHIAVADVLAQGLAGFDELLSLPAFGGRVDLLIDCLALLIHSGQVLPVSHDGNLDVRPAQRFNRVIAERARTGQFYKRLAAPIARTGIPIDEFGVLALGATLEGRTDPVPVAEQGLAALDRLGRRPRRDDRPIEDDSSAVTFLVERISRVFEEQVPLWQRLGAV